MPISDEQAADARSRLRDFLAATHEQLGAFCNSERYTRLMVEPMRQPLRQAWSEYAEHFDLDANLARIGEAGAEALESHGLFGSQLDAKLALIAYWRDLFEDLWNRRVPPNRLPGILGRWIDAIDVLLESLIQAAGLDGAIKELKDLAGASLDITDTFV